MYIVTYGKNNLTFKAATKKEAERVVRRCEVDQGQLSPDPPEGKPKVMTAKEYLAAANLKKLAEVSFDDPAYL